MLKMKCLKSICGLRLRAQRQGEKGGKVSIMERINYVLKRLRDLERIKGEKLVGKVLEIEGEGY